MSAGHWLALLVVLSIPFVITAVVDFFVCFRTNNWIQASYLVTVLWIITGAIILAGYLVYWIGNLFVGWGIA